MKSNRFVCLVALLMLLSIACSLTEMQVEIATPIPTDAPTLEASQTPDDVSLVATEDAQPPILFDGKLICTPKEIFAKCLDGLLRIEYEYPIHWGVLSANLQTANEVMTGSAYDYLFDGKPYGTSMPLIAGGRSKDFSMGRGGMYTDFSGYVPGDPYRDGSCTTDTYYALCENVNPNLTWMISFPDAAALCEASGGPGFSLEPFFRVEINLPDNPTIHGFVWHAPFVSDGLSKQMDSDLYSLLGANADSVTKCDADSQQKFNAQRAIYLDQFKNNTVESETQDKLDELHHLVDSIIFH